MRTEIGSYQHHVQRLTSENGQLRDELATLRAEYKQEARKLRALLDEGISPELTAVRREMERQRERADSASRDAAETRRKQGILVTAAAAWLREATGCSGVEAMEKILAAIGGEERTVTGVGADRSVVEEHSPASVARVRSLQRSRGHRSSPERVAKLDALTEAALADGGS